MKCISHTILTILLSSHSLTTGEEIKGGRTLPAVYCTSTSIKGTTFKTEDIIQHDDDWKWYHHQCRIGYERVDKEGYRLSPVLDFPGLTNDWFSVEFTDGRMVVTAHKANRMIVTLYLDGIVPNMITDPKTKSSEHIVELDSQHKDFEDIEGTTLSFCHALPSEKEPEKSASPSVIGYKRVSAERSTFTPVLSMPHLQNDRYVVKFAKGSIFVKTKNHGNDVVELNLENLAPSAITAIYGEPAGAGQPATKPADKPPVKDQPSPPTSKDSPR